MNRLAYGCKTWAVVSGVILLGLWWMAGFSAFVEAREGGASVDLATAVARVARENIAAVVHIEVIEPQEMVNRFLPFENDPFFRYSLDVPRRSRKFESELNGLGTGMIMDDRGHILSNHHVVGEATEIRVLVAGGKRYPAYLVGSDPKTDLAVLQIVAGEGLPHVVFGDSDEVEVGDWVVAIGHPQGMDHTVAQGIISAQHHKGIWDPSSYRDFLQTDAVINPGNSGGPLLNLRGKVIGVNTAIVSQSREFEGIGFAIPSNMALHIAGKLIAFGEVERGWLGVSVQDLAPEMAESLGLATSKGALIADVVETGPADQAGIKRGDVVILYQGEPILDASSLHNEVAISPIGQEALLTVARGGQRLELRVKVGRLDEASKMRTGAIRARLGADVRPVTFKEADLYGLNSEQGVVVVWVDPAGPLGRVGFEVNDVILEINGQSIETSEAFVGMVGSLRPYQRVTLLALDHRSGRTSYVQVVAR